MWSYYGSKSNLVDFYPPPKFGKIIEPFAGSARYALKYWDRDVLLVDAYDVVVKIWHYLQQCSEQDILGLPKMKKGDDIRTYGLSDQELLFLSMMAGASSTAPRYKVSPFTAEKNGYRNLYKVIASKLHRIKHWKIEHGEYIGIPNQEATWFIDPPYQFGGHAYVMSSRNIDFDHLSSWCEGRKGQSIVCENTKATWMSFSPLKRHRGSKNTTVEAMWTNQPTSCNVKQTELFI